MKVITDLAINQFSEDEIINICKKVCNTFNVDFKDIAIKMSSLTVIVLVKGTSEDVCKIESKLSGIFIGYADRETYKDVDVELQLTTDICPIVFVTNSEERFLKRSSALEV